jgi:hypothetical protein
MNKYFFRLDRRRRHKASRYRSYAYIAGIISVVLGYGLAKADTDPAPLLPPAKTHQQIHYHFQILQDLPLSIIVRAC